MSHTLQKPDNQYYETITICFLQFDSCKFRAHFRTRITVVRRLQRRIYLSVNLRYNYFQRMNPPLH